VPIVEPVVERQIPPAPVRAPAAGPVRAPAGGAGRAPAARPAPAPAPAPARSTLSAAPNPLERARAWLEHLGGLTPADADYERTSRAFRRAAAVLLVLGICGFLIDGANRPANPHLVQNKAPATLHPKAASTVSGWGTLKAASLSVGGKHDCVVEAVTTAEQNRGLMGRTTVAPYTGMAFVFSKPTTVAFYMKDTLIPLSVAWFDADGSYIGTAQMPPCPPSVVNCPTFSAARPYTLAVEVPAGHLAAAGIGPGATAHLGGPCT
jgi:uncharacterized membrane protein (UPF0127 family)